MQRPQPVRATVSEMTIDPIDWQLDQTIYRTVSHEHLSHSASAPWMTNCVIRVICRHAVQFPPVPESLSDELHLGTVNNHDAFDTHIFFNSIPTPLKTIIVTFFTMDFARCTEGLNFITITASDHGFYKIFWVVSWIQKYWINLPQIVKYLKIFLFLFITAHIISLIMETKYFPFLRIEVRCASCAVYIKPLEHNIFSIPHCEHWRDRSATHRAFATPWTCSRNDGNRQQTNVHWTKSYYYH